MELDLLDVKGPVFTTLPRLLIPLNRLIYLFRNRPSVLSAIDASSICDINICQSMAWLSLSEPRRNMMHRSCPALSSRACLRVGPLEAWSKFVQSGINTGRLGCVFQLSGWALCSMCPLCVGPGESKAVFLPLPLPLPTTARNHR